jgi:peptide/nickel transport system ATP-binding protein
MSMLFVTHNLGVVAQYADAVAVMYAGRIVESARVHDLFARPEHPYTRGLLACLPGVARRQAQATDHAIAAGRRKLVAIPGQVSSPLAPPPGCAFAPRCTRQQPDCTHAMPALEAAGPRRMVRCLHREVHTEPAEVSA